MRFDVDPELLFDDYEGFETASIEKIPRNKKIARAMANTGPKHFIDKSYPSWGKPGSIDPTSKIIFAGLVRLDPLAEEVSSEQKLQQLENQAEAEGYY